MPYSAKSFDFMLQEHIKLLNPTSILDVGAGAGKNGKLIRETGYTNKLECLEPTAEYVNKFKLDTIYDTVHPVSLQQFVETQYKFQYDVVVFGDVLEHLFRSKVIDYIDYFLYKSKWLIIAWPNNMPQDDTGNNPYEIHKSNFKLNDLTEKFDVQFYAKNFCYFNGDYLSDATLNYTVIKGYLTPINTSLYNLGFKGNWQ